MTRGLAAALFAALALAAPSAEAGGPVEEPFARWSAEAHVPLPRGTVAMSFDLDGDQNAWMDSSNVIHWYSDPTVVDRWPVARPVFLHELGHVYDYTTLRSRTRAKLVALFPGWWPYFTEKFAMLYSNCAMGAYPIPGYGGYDYAPAVWKHRRGCGILRRSTSSFEFRARRFE